jgi:hypothetical protein
VPVAGSVPQPATSAPTRDSPRAAVRAEARMLVLLASRRRTPVIRATGRYVTWYTLDGSRR